MSSWASYYTAEGFEIISRNYTHNCNGLAQVVIEERWGRHHQRWWQILDGMNGAEGHAFLSMLIDGIASLSYTEIQAGGLVRGGGRWGSRDSFLEHLAALRVSCAADSHGYWRTSG